MTEKTPRPGALPRTQSLMSLWPRLLERHRSMSPHSKASQRGATIVLTLVLIAAVMLAATLLLRRSELTMESANATRHRFVANSCADGAREMLLSRFRTFDVNFSELTLDMSVAGKRYTSGHYDNFNIQSVTPLGGSRVLADEHVTGIANRTIRTGLGGAPYRIVVVCTDSEGGRQNEVEFLVRFGL